MKTLFKRWGIFLTVNLLIMAVLGIILSFFGLEQQDWIGLLVISALFGFTGAFISLLLSKTMAKMSYQIKPLKRENATGKALFLYDTIEKMAAHRGIKMPEFGIYQSADNNAFATGASKNKSLIAFSSGILQNLDEEELAAVAGHEMTHVTEGDMVTTTLLMGTLNTFVMFFAHVVAAIISGALRGRDSDNRARSSLAFGSSYLIAMVLQNVLMIFANIVLAAYSRHREYAADAGAADLTSPGHMITALEKISGAHVREKREDAYSIAKIHNLNALTLFATHPPIKKRIEALRKKMV